MAYACIVIPMGDDSVGEAELLALCADAQEAIGPWASHVLTDEVAVPLLIANLHAEGHKWPDCPVCPTTEGGHNG